MNWLTRSNNMREEWSATGLLSPLLHWPAWACRTSGCPRSWLDLLRVASTWHAWCRWDQPQRHHPDTPNTDSARSCPGSPCLWTLEDNNKLGVERTLVSWSWVSANLSSARCESWPTLSAHPKWEGQQRGADPRCSQPSWRSCSAESAGLFRWVGGSWSPRPERRTAGDSEWMQSAWVGSLLRFRPGDLHHSPRQ